MSNREEEMQRFYAAEVRRLHKAYTSALKKVKEANTTLKLYNAAVELEPDIDITLWPPYLETQQEIEDHIHALDDEVRHIMFLWEEGDRQLIRELAPEYKRAIILHLTPLIASLEATMVSKHAANMMLTEKEFLSEKVPKDVADNIASFVTGKKGTLGAQLSQLAVDSGKPGVSSKNGGKKTKKNRTKRRKTHGRRV